MKIKTISPRDIIGLISLIICFILIGFGINHIVSGIAIMIITYYFSKRVYEETNTFSPEKKIEKVIKPALLNK